MALLKNGFPALLLWFFIFSATERMWAHAPYDVNAGTFMRSDGVTISVVKHYVDGILGSDPVSVQFIAPGGAAVDALPFTQEDIIIKTRMRGADIFRFPSSWLPIAVYVGHFDGYTLINVTSPTKRTLSLWIHLRAKLGSYLGAFLIAWPLAAAWVRIFRRPRERNRDRLRGPVLFLLAGLILFYCMLIVWIAGISPFVLAALAAAATGLKNLALSIMKRRRVFEADAA